MEHTERKLDKAAGVDEDENQNNKLIKKALKNSIFGVFGL